MWSKAAVFLVPALILAGGAGAQGDGTTNAKPPDSHVKVKGRLHPSLTNVLQECR